MEQLGRPMTVAELRAAVNDEGFVSAVVGVSLDDLIDGELDDFNDRAAAWVTGSIVGLTDISYEPVGVNREESMVLVKVTGHVEWNRLE